MTKKEFWIRFAIWISFFLVAPFVYISVEFGIFSEQTSRSLSGWGIIAVFFLMICGIILLNMVRKSMRKGTMWRQCFDGAFALLPILCIIFALETIKNNVSDFQKFLIFLVVCEAIAVPINPFPKWDMQHGMDEKENWLIGLYKKTFGKEK